MHGRRGNIANVGLVEVILPDEMDVSEEEDDGMRFPPFIPVTNDSSSSGWGKPDSRRAVEAPSEVGWGEPNSDGILRVGYMRNVDEPEPAPEVARVGYLEVIDGPSPEAKSSRHAVDDWGYTREKNCDSEPRSTWARASITNPGDDSEKNCDSEPRSTWARASITNPGDDSNWTTPDWSATSGADGWTSVGRNERRPQATERDDRYIRYDGEPVIVETREDVDIWCDRIRDSGVSALGFDTEWKPERRRGQDNTIALIQICFFDPILKNHQVVLFHTIQTGMTRKLKELLQDRSVIKAGVDLTCDKRKLEYHFGVRLDKGMDLGIEYSKIVNGGAKGSKRVGMKRLVKLVLGLEMKKPKSLQTVNWERPLAYATIQYGALDAYVCSRVYEELFEK